MNNIDLKIKAIGRNARIGSFYDAYNDRFLVGISLFENTCHKIESTDISNTYLNYVYSDSLKEKFQSLDINGELKASILSGLINIEGSCKYMSQDKLKNNSIKSTFIYNISTKSERINFFNKSIKKQIKLEALKNAQEINATHVVCGIEWGAKCYATFEKEFKKSESEMVIVGDLKGKFEKLKNSLNLNGRFKADDNDKADFKEFSLNFQADILPNNETLPTSVEAMIPFLKNISQYIQKCNDGKGIQIDYFLFPLKKIIEIMGFEIKCDKIINDLKVEIINKLEQELDIFTKQKQIFNQFKDDVDKYLRFFFKEETIKKIADKDNLIKENESKFKSK